MIAAPVAAAMRELFVYYRVQHADAAAARAAVLDLQSALRAANPALHTRWLCREDAGADAQTWMEIYATAASRGGVSPDLQAAIEREAHIRLGRWIVGSRHTEVFVASTPPDAADATKPPADAP